MYNLHTTNNFTRKLRTFLKKHPALENNIEDKLNALSSNPSDPVLKKHKLHGRLKNEFTIWLTYEYRILFLLTGNDIYLTNIGTHDEIY